MSNKCKGQTLIPFLVAFNLVINVILIFFVVNHISMIHNLNKDSIDRYIECDERLKAIEDKLQ